MRALALGAVLALSSCRGVPVTPPALLQGLVAGRHLVGVPVALGPAVIFNREDFVWDARPSPDGQTVALARLGMRSYFLSLHEVGGRRRADTVINALEFDVEALDFSPDARFVATVSRDAALRVFDAASGAMVGAWPGEEPLVSLAFDASGQRVAVGGSRGRITLLSFPSLAFVAEVQGHSDEVRGLAFAPSGELFSAGWDRRVSVWSVATTLEAQRSVRTQIERHDGFARFRAALDGRASASFAIDARLPTVVVRPALAAAVGLDPAALTEAITVQTALGAQRAPLAHGRSLTIKELRVSGLDVAICEVCVPAGAQGAVGAAFLAQLETVFDESAHEVIFTAAAGVAVQGSGGRLVRARSFEFPAPINDLTLDARGAVLGLAFSETKAQRTREIYQREKQGLVEPERAWDGAARVEAQTGRVLQVVHGHRGVVATAAVSPDGQTLATGGWDKRVIVHAAQALIDDRYGWAVRRVRYSRDGRWLVVAAWTPQNPLGDHQSNAAGLMLELRYDASASISE